MRFGYSETCLAHDTGARHPENPDRLRAIRRGLADRHGVEYVQPEPADRATIEAVHDPDYVDEFEAFCADGGGNWDLDTVAVEATFEAAVQSAGLAAWAGERALAGDDGRSTPFALGRPPGHHADADDAAGFCFLNNVAVAAEAALDGDAGRVAILDWDVHHGDGTQEIFYDRGDVFFASIHESGLYPGTGAVEDVGTGDGEGTTLNVPVPAGAGDVDYTAVLDRVVLPAIRSFEPDLLLVSTGFDAHRHDPISRTRVSTEGYGCLARRLRTFVDPASGADGDDGDADEGAGDGEDAGAEGAANADGADDADGVDVGVAVATPSIDAGVAFVLEGGYGLDTLAEGVGTVHEVFDGYDPVEPEGDLESRTETVLAELEADHPALAD